MARGIKHKIIKRLMKAVERIPRADDYHLSEIFHHSSFTEGTTPEREAIMLKSSEWAYHDESRRHTFESYFRFDFPRLLKVQTALDLGCFTGGRAVAWAECWQLSKIYGIDTHEVFIDAAQRFADSRTVNARFVCARGEKLPFNDEVFDAVLSYDVFEHVQDITQVLRECHRVLKKHGRLFVVFPSFYGLSDHHLSLVTITPLIHVIFDKNDIISVYNEIIRERGVEAAWYQRPNPELESWERGNTINGTTSASFRRIIKNMKWKIVAENHIPILGGMRERYWFLRLVCYMIYPFVGLPLFKEFLSTRIIYILEKI